MRSRPLLPGSPTKAGQPNHRHSKHGARAFKTREGKFAAPDPLNLQEWQELLFEVCLIVIRTTAPIRYCYIVGWEWAALAVSQ